MTPQLRPLQVSNRLAQLLSKVGDRLRVVTARLFQKHAVSWSLLLALFIGAFATRAFSQENFTVIVLPDPQNYSQFFPGIFNAQTQWVVQNRVSRNIKFVIGLGDTVNHPESTVEWQNADAAIRILDVAGVR